MRIAVVTATSVGKNVTSPTITVTPHSPRPKSRAINGVMAMIGTDRNAIAVGITSASRNGEATTPAATATEATDPMAKPTAVSTSVVPSADHTALRSSLAVVRNRHTSSGRLAKYGLRSNQRSVAHHTNTRIATDATPVSEGGDDPAPGLAELQHGDRPLARRPRHAGSGRSTR